MFSFRAGSRENQTLLFLREWTSGESAKSVNVSPGLLWEIEQTLLQPRKISPKCLWCFCELDLFFLSGFWCCMLWKSNDYKRINMFFKKKKKKTTFTFCPAIKWWLYFMCNGCFLAFLIWLTVPGAVLPTHSPPPIMAPRRFLLSIARGSEGLIKAYWGMLISKKKDEEEADVKIE